jgi:hypothetical protein
MSHEVNVLWAARVHHAVNDMYIDKNYGGILILWDRLFGTFIEERDSEKIVYGTRSPLRSWNPLWANLEVYKALWLDATHDEVLANPCVWRAEVERLTGIQIYDLHLKDAVNLKHPSYFDSTYDYEMLVFRKLAPASRIGPNKAAADPEQTLTVITALFMPLTVITGVFGMNFVEMPLLRDRAGFWITIGMMALIVAGLLIFFRRKRYLEDQPPDHGN